MDTVQHIIKNHKAVLFYLPQCMVAHRIRSVFKFYECELYCPQLNDLKKRERFQKILKTFPGNDGFPYLFINGTLMGSGQENLEYLKNDRNLFLYIDSLQKIKGNLQSKSSITKFDYDVVVIGGGSGGISCAKEAASCGKKVCLVNWVEPTPLGTKWGLGGTCVNVGCIPKRLLHHAAVINEHIKDASFYGWEFVNEIKHNWNKIISAIQNHIHHLNFTYRVELKKKSIDYKNVRASIETENIIALKDENDSTSCISAKNIVIAVGGRPRYPKIEGAKEYGITSDDLFSLNRYPGKILIVGGGYIATECAGFLQSLGCEVILMVRSVLLRNFDSEMAALVRTNLENLGVTFLDDTIPLKVKKELSNSQTTLTVDYRNTKNAVNGKLNCDTVLFAIGRDPSVKELISQNLAITKDDSTGKFLTVNARTNINNIFAIGDCALELRVPPNVHSELTPVAIKTGAKLGQDLGGKAPFYMDYRLIPTTVFTPIEYASVGYSEDEAKKCFETINVYHRRLWPYFWTLAQRPPDICYMKAITDEKDKIIGLHYFGPQASEIIQGFVVALRMKAKIQDLNETIGVHPTCAEALTTLSITKSSGIPLEIPGC